MVTAETAEFMSDGGMGQVAADLPMSFNNKYGPKGHKTTVITPLYNGQGKVVHRLEHGKDGFDYYYGKNAEVKIPLEYVGYVNVPIYDGSHDSNTGLRDNQVRVLKGRHKNTDIIFLDTSNNKAKNDKGLPIKNCNIFGITAGNFKLDPYTNNGTDPITRMSYFSKAVYETMKAAKQGKLDGILMNCRLFSLSITQNTRALQKEMTISTECQFLRHCCRDFLRISSRMRKLLICRGNTRITGWKIP